VCKEREKGGGGGRKCVSERENVEGGGKRIKEIWERKKDRRVVEARGLNVTILNFYFYFSCYFKFFPNYILDIYLIQILLVINLTHNLKQFFMLLRYNYYIQSLLNQFFFCITNL
jgi:hypothetical protein